MSIIDFIIRIFSKKNRKLVTNVSRILKYLVGDSFWIAKFRITSKHVVLALSFVLSVSFFGDVLAEGRVSSQHLYLQSEIPPDTSIKMKDILGKACENTVANSSDVLSILRGPILFGYSREMIEDGLSMNHLLYTWSDDKMRFEIQTLKGSAIDSISILNQNHASLYVDGRYIEVNYKELSKKLYSYGIHNIYKMQFNLCDIVENQFSHTLASYIGRARTADGGMIHIIRANAEDKNGVIAIGLDVNTNILKKVWYRLADGLWEYEYSLNRVSIAGLVLPFKIELTFNGVKKEIFKVTRLEILAQPSDKYMKMDSHVEFVKR